jgi:hypothetical protein
MGAVIKFPWVRQLRRKPATMPGASAVVIILPVIRIERALDAPSPVKARRPKSVAARSVAARSVTKSAVGRKRRKRAAPELPSPACSGG